MPELTNSKARRGGSTARRWHETVQKIKIGATSDGVRFMFHISGNNNGFTDIEIDIGVADFKDLVQHMSMVDRHAAMVAMSAELARQVSVQPNRDKDIVYFAQEAVSEYANEKYYGQEEAAQVFAKGVEDLISELRESAKSEAESQ